MTDILIVGGGVIGLSLAWELASHGLRVRVVDRGALGREASWAGAGILPPANAKTALHPYDQLRALSFDLHPQWAERLREKTGIDNGFRRCGGLYLARTAGETAALRGMWNVFQEEAIRIERLDDAGLACSEPALTPAIAARRFKAAYEVADECQLRNPRHLQALMDVCRQRGVELSPELEARGFVIDGSRIEGLRTANETLRAGAVCITGGAWTQGLLAQLGCETGILPIRGQMLLYKCDRRPFTRVLNEGNRYMVARDDGYVLAGSTEEEVGFDKRTTEIALADLHAFATALVPDLASAKLEQSWAGLRPATFDGFPYLGRLPGFDNAFAAAGHFRSGLYLSPGTAVVMSQLIRGQTPQVDLTPFRVGRG